MTPLRVAPLAPFLLVALAACAESTTDDAGETATLSSELVAATIGPVAPNASAIAALDTSVAATAVRTSAVQTSIVVGATGQAVDMAVTPVQEPVRLVEVVAESAGLEFGAVGLVVAQVDGAVVVREVMPGLAAAEAGIEPGWAVLTVDGMDAADMTLEQFVGLVRGDAGTEVALTVVPPGAEAREVALERRTLVVPETRCERIRRVRSETEFGGVGLRLEGGCAGVRVVGVEDGLPAAAAGLQAGDLVRSVDGMQLEGAHLMEVISAIRGEVGTPVELGVVGSDGTERNVTLDRVAIAVPASACTR